VVKLRLAMTHICVDHGSMLVDYALMICVYCI